MTTTLPYQGSSRTSKLGAIAAAPGAESQRERIIAYVQAYGPSTRAEISAATGIKIPAVCARVYVALYDQLDRKGNVTQEAELRRGGERFCRETGFLAETVMAIAPPLKQGALQL